MLTCTRSIEFDTAHRVYKHEGKCAHLHGHRYRVLISADAPELDELGRVIDFSVLKQRVGGWADEVLDHGLLLHKDDPLVNALDGQRARNNVRQKIKLMDCNPTAENIAKLFLLDVCPAVLQGTGVRVVLVRVYETPNCFADAHWPHEGIPHRG